MSSEYHTVPDNTSPNRPSFQALPSENIEAAPLNPPTDVNPKTHESAPPSVTEPATGTIFANPIPAPALSVGPPTSTSRPAGGIKHCVKVKVKKLVGLIFGKRALPRTTPAPNPPRPLPTNPNRGSTTNSSADKLIVSPSNHDSWGFSFSDDSRRDTASSTGRYKYLESIGQGGNGIVFLAKDRRIGSLVAIKTLRTWKPRSFIPDEVKILDKMGRHPNIVQYHTAFQEPENVDGTGRLYTKIVMEYYKLGDLHDYVVAKYRPEPAPEMFLWHILTEISTGLAHMHSRGIIHGDLKASNILCGVPSSSSALWPDFKITDFGASTINPPVNIPMAHHGTYGYMPPESATYFGPETDVWALGVIVHWVTVGRTPWKSITPTGLKDSHWLVQHHSSIPDNIPHKNSYKKMLVWFRRHQLDIVDLHKDMKTPHSKLLAYLLSRTLAPERASRIQASDLSAVLPTLETFALAALQGGNADLLDTFENVDMAGRTVGVGIVLQQLIKATKARAKAGKNQELKGLVEALVRLVKSL